MSENTFLKKKIRSFNSLLGIYKMEMIIHRIIEWVTGCNVHGGEIISTGNNNEKLGLLI